MLMLPPNKESLICLTSASTYPEMVDLRISPLSPAAARWGCRWTPARWPRWTAPAPRPRRRRWAPPTGPDPRPNRRPRPPQGWHLACHTLKSDKMWQDCEKSMGLTVWHGPLVLAGDGFPCTLFFYTSTLLESARKCNILQQGRDTLVGLPWDPRQNQWQIGCLRPLQCWSAPAQELIPRAQQGCTDILQ